jgi:hypothetical protein
MKVLLCISLFIVGSFLKLHGQTKSFLDSLKGRWIERQAEYMQIEWHFHSGGNFTSISFSGGERPTLEGRIFRAKYSVDTLNWIITVANYQYLNLTNGKSFPLDSNESITRWKVLSNGNDKLRLMEIQYYEKAIKDGPIDYNKWNTRLLFRPHLVYLPKAN